MAHEVLINWTYLGYLIGMTTASLSKRFAFSKPLMLSHLTSGLPRTISLHKMRYMVIKVTKFSGYNRNYPWPPDKMYAITVTCIPLCEVFYVKNTWLNFLLTNAFLLIQKPATETSVCGVHKTCQ